MLSHHLLGDSRNQRRLAMTPVLILRLEPVPALPAVRQAVLRGIGDEEAVLLGERIHPRPRGEVVGDWVQPWSITMSGARSVRLAGM